MRIVVRIINLVFWLAVFLAIAVQFGGFHDLPRIAGETVIPAVLWFAIDRIIKAKI